MPGQVQNALAWKVNEIQDLKESPPVSVITTPYVARYYGVQDEYGIHLDFNGTRQYIPRVVLYAVYAPILVENEMTAAMDNHCFKRKSLKARNQPIETQARFAWASSPRMLQHVLENSLKDEDEGGYKVKFMLDKEIRETYISPILAKLNSHKLRDDQKLMSLVTILKDHCINRKEKAIIFAERHPTISYLEDALQTLLPGLSVASTVEKTPSGKYQLKNRKTVTKLINDFAPVANHCQSEQHYDVFIATDAYGVGVNLQDASVVINYDLSWTPIEPDQRAGRILRFWSDPRDVSLYVFVPTFEEDSQYRRETQLVQRRWENLISRHGQAKAVTDLPTITRQNHHRVDMPSHAGRKNIKQIGEIDVRVVEEDIASSDIFQHTAILVKYRDFAKAIADDIASAKVYDGQVPIFYILLFYQNKYYWVLYDVKHRTLLDRKKDVELLSLIRAEESTPTAVVDPLIIEKLADRCIHRWCQANGAEENDILRICSLLLVPSSMDNFENMFN